MATFQSGFGKKLISKVPLEYAISQYELSLLSQYSGKSGVLMPKASKQNVLTYPIGKAKTLRATLKGKETGGCLLPVIKAVLRAVKGVQEIGLRPEQILFSPDLIYITQPEGKVQVLYYPVNGGEGYDYILFLRDLFLWAQLAPQERSSLNTWVKELSKTGDIMAAMRALDKLQLTLACLSDTAAVGVSNTSRAKAARVAKPLPEIEEEPMTDVDDLAFDDEPMTDADDEPMTDAGDDPYDELEEEPMTDADDEPFSYQCKVGVKSSMETDLLRKKVPSLVLESTGQTFRIAQTPFLIGRSRARATACITGNQEISSVHATITERQGGYYIEDNHSTNGTSLNGVWLAANGKPERLQENSVITLGGERLTFHLT